MLKADAQKSFVTKLPTKVCLICKEKISEGYTWDDKKCFVCSDKCLHKMEWGESETNADLNSGTVYWSE